MYVHCSTEVWSTSDGCLMGSEFLTRNNFHFISLRKKLILNKLKLKKMKIFLWATCVKVSVLRLNQRRFAIL